MSDHETIIEGYEIERRLQARIQRLRALVQELNKELAAETGDEPYEDRFLEKLYYPTIERGDMTEE